MNNTDSNVNKCIEKEINLLTTILKRKKFIIIFTMLVTILSIVYFIIKTPIYEVKSNVKIGFIGNEYITKIPLLERELKIVFNVDDKLELEEYISEVISIKKSKHSENYIEIKTQAISNEEAVKKNKEVIEYIQNLHIIKINNYILNTKNSIEKIKRDIENVDNFEIKNITEQIRLLKTQKIKAIENQINFYINTEIKALESKINFHIKKLEEYKISLNTLYENSKLNKDSTLLAISSMQMVNYQNMILNSQNKIEDLKIQKENITEKIIPKLKKEKENVLNEDIRKLQYIIDVDLVNKKITYNELISKLKFNMSEHNIQNSKLIGNYIIKNDPLTPSKKTVLISFIIGFIFSIIIVIIFELFLKEIREE